VAATAGLPLIVVMPDAGRGGEAGWYSDWADGSRQWESFHTGVLVDWVDATYRTRGDGHRAVLGMSMGGFGAMKYAARHPGLFRAAASFSGAVDTRYAAPASGAAYASFGEPLGSPGQRVWGDQVADEETWKAHNPTDRAADHRGTELGVASGTGTPGGPAGDDPSKAGNYPIEAFIFQMNASFAGALTRAGVPFTQDFYLGGYHDWPYWQRELHRALPFLGHAVGGEAGCEGQAGAAAAAGGDGGAVGRAGTPAAPAARPRVLPAVAERPAAPQPPPQQQPAAPPTTAAVASTAEARAGARPDAEPPDRSVFAEALVAFDDLSTDAGVVARNLGLTLALVLLLTFPAELFNRTAEQNADEIRGWLAPLAPLAPLRRVLPPAPVAAIAAAGLYGFLDPDLGLDAASAALVVGLLVAIAAATATHELSTAAHARRRFGVAGRFRVYPGALVVAIACVAVSRLVGFAPGYLFGLVAGFDFTGRLSEEEEGRALAHGARNMLLLAGAAYVLWGPVDGAVQGGDGGFPMLVLDAVLAATFVAGLQGVLFGLLPLRFLDGEKVLRYSQLVWLALFGPALFAFVHVMLHPRAGFLPTSSRVSVATVFGLFAAFALFSFSFWGYFRLREEPEDDDEDADLVETAAR
jgi:S-formylglutathione hydrolase FrmB